MITVNIPSVRSHVVHDRKFRPWHLSGLAMWLDGADAASIALDGSNNVSQWSDKSGNGRHVLQGSATLRPSYTSSNQVNGITVPRFDGSDDTMSTTGGSTISQPSTSYVVFKFESGGAANPTLWDGSSSRQWLVLPSSTSVQAYANAALTPTVSNLVGAVTQVGVLYSGGSSTIRMNGSQISSGNLGSAGIGTNVVVGSNPFGLGSFKGCIAELLIYSKALSTTERDNVESYLKARWGTP